MKKLDKLKKVKGYIIHCHTLIEATQLCLYLHTNGYRWHDGEFYNTKNNWNIYKENTCYNPYNGTFARLDYYKAGRPEGYDYDFNIIDLKKFFEIV